MLLNKGDGTLIEYKTEEIKMSEDKKITPQMAFIMSMCVFREKLKQPKMDATNPFFKSKYITLGGVVDAIDDVAAECDLTYIQLTDIKDGHFGVVTKIMHISGHTETGFYLLPSTGKSQEIGASLTYAKRYALSAAFGIVADEDDDGNSATQPAKKPQPVVTQPTKEQDELFKNHKKQIKEFNNLEALSGFWKLEYNNMVDKLPDSYVKELVAKKDEMKQFLTKGE
jgi:hypothetical protein